MLPAAVLDVEHWLLEAAFLLLFVLRVGSGFASERTDVVLLISDLAIIDVIQWGSKFVSKFELPSRLTELT